MSELIVITYPDVNRASQVMSSLQTLITEHLIDLDDAAYITKDASGKIELHQSLNLPGVGAATGGASGALWGTLIGLLFLQPLAGAAIGAAVGAGTGAIVGKFSDYGIDDNFMKQLSANMTPNSSATFVLVRRATPDKVIPEVSKFGGTVLHTSLSKDAEAKLQAALTQGAAVATPAPDAQSASAAPSA